MKKLASLLTILLICVSCAACRADTRELILVIEKDFIEEDLAGFKLYVSNESGTAYAVIPNETNPTSPFTLDYIPGGNEFPVDVTLQVPIGVNITYYFVATALDYTLNESGYSPEASKSYFIPPPTTTVPTTTTTIDDEAPDPPDSLRIVKLRVKLMLKIQGKI